MIKNNLLFWFGFFGKDGRAKDDSEGNEETHVPKDLPFVPPPGTVIYTVLPDGAPVPQGTVVYGPPPAAASGGSIAPGSVIYGPPPVGAQVVYGPLPPNFTVPLIPVGVLHCNVPEHHDLVRYRAVSCRFNHSRLTYEWIRKIF